MQLTQHMGITGGVILPPVWFRTGHTCWLLCWCQYFVFLKKKKNTRLCKYV